jgi:hypothetical protein
LVLMMNAIAYSTRASVKKSFIASGTKLLINQPWVGL